MCRDRLSCLLEEEEHRVLIPAAGVGVVFFSSFQSLGAAVASLVGSFSVVMGGLNASRLLHDTTLGRVLRAPISFFDVTPVGRILNRFSRDQDSIDTILPETLASALRSAVSGTSSCSSLDACVPCPQASILPYAQNRLVFFLLLLLTFCCALGSGCRIHALSHSSCEHTGADVHRCALLCVGCSSFWCSVLLHPSVLLAQLT
jgi:ABC-type multidrug transport system fused ATPase/permease subunit